RPRRFSRRPERGRLSIGLLSTARRSRLLAAAALLWAVRWRWEPVPDQSWYLHVANKFLHGGVLYRDMFLGVPPLSMYAAAGAVALAGSELVGLRAVNCLVFALTLCLCAWQARRAGAADRTIVLMALAFPPGGRPTSRLALQRVRHAVLRGRRRSRAQ